MFFRKFKLLVSGSMVLSFLTAVSLCFIQVSLLSTGAYAQVKDACPSCGKSLSYIKEYSRWYCESEGKYMDEGYDPAKVVKKLPPPPAKKLPPPPGAKKLPPPPGMPAKGSSSAASGDEALVFSFEDISQLIPNDPEENQSTLIPESDSEYVTQGSVALKVSHEGGNYPGMEIPGSVLELKDWSGYKTMLIDVYNPGDKTTTIDIFLANASGQNSTECDISVKPGKNTIKLNLQRVSSRLRDGMDIARLRIWQLGEAITVPSVIYYDNLRLVK
ncbi:MAG: hypothetical protein A2252_00420 [Elusimicrobia bacterium RIFOXYA2_FULL_39_19]|nr:MAG: hypothetical protein A2252_00420 [Elusimicrobia bacterium RIFOXYA2_FULL_39_19]